MPIKIFYSNYIEQLYQKFKGQLFAKPCAPFDRRLIIVPTQAIKSWLLLQLATDPEMGIATGLEILHLNDSFQKILSITTQEKTIIHYPNPLELTLAIESEIRTIGLNWNTLSSEQKKCWKPLFDYLKINFSTKKSFQLSQRSERRLIAIAKELGELFLDYGKYGHAMLKKWTPDQGWQQALWHTLFSSAKNWSYTARDYESLNLSNIPLKNIQVYLFSISFIAKSDQLLLDKISNLVPIHYFMLSPCLLFWHDILSDKEAQKLQQYWKRKNVSLKEQSNLEEYLRDKNTLLANWGKLGRKVAEFFDRDEYEIMADYVLPSSLKQLEAYSFADDTIHWKQSPSPSNILEKVQADILLMRNPTQGPKIEIDHDYSIQLHRAPSIQREIQILYHNLLHAFQCDPTLTPSDIIVMAPCITDYAPFIQQIFGSEESQFDYQLMDMQSAGENSIIEQFWHLIQLPLSRWNVEDILELFNSPCFRKKQQLSEEDILQIRQWIQMTGIQWGEDFSHRNEILNQHHCKEMEEESHQGTWEEGFSKLLLGLVQFETELLKPVSVDSSMTNLLGKFIHLTRSLRQDLKKFSDVHQKTYSDWMTELKKLADTYLLDSIESEEGVSLLYHFNLISSAAKWIPDQKVSFHSVRQHLETSLNKPQATFRETHLQTVKFCSMLPMRTIPAKIIALLGMCEGSFPRTDHRNSLNLMQNHSLCDYYPSQSDFDRYLFLETLLSARQHFILSYTTYAPEDGKEQGPSLLVSELLTYLDQAYRVKNQKVSDCMTYNHPYFSFDASYFSSHSKIKNFSTSDFQSALSFYSSEKKPAHRFIHDFKPTIEPVLDVEELTIDIQQIKTALHNPFKTFFNKNLGIYIRDQDELDTEETFTIDHLQLYHFKKESLKLGLNEIIKEAEKRGKLPLGLFKETAKLTIHQAIEDLQENLTKMNVSTSPIFSIELHDQYQNAADWKLPPLLIKYKNQSVKIVGKLDEVCSEGLIAHIYGNKDDIVKNWGEFIVLNALIDTYKLPIKKQLLCTKSGRIKTAPTENSQETLVQTIDYYFYSLHNISPLNTEWVYSIIHQSSEDLETTINKCLTNQQKMMRNPYIQYSCRYNGLNGSNLQEHWREIGQHLFSKILQTKASSDE